jgi:23S rRNA pseudouridine2604 synthase
MRSKKNIRSTGAPKANTAAKAKFAPKAKHHVKAKPALPPSTNSKQKSTVKVDGIQLNKYISSSGFCSRRQAELYIEEGRVTINDDIAELTQRVQAGDEVAVDGEIIKLKTGKQSLYLVFNKPKGVTSTTDPADKSNIIYFINHPKRIFPIGRLDKDSEGLILLTNDGDIVNKILRAGNEHEKEYIVSVNKPLSPEFTQQMARGIPILGTVTKPCVVRQLGSKTFKIILTEGLNRQIRRMCEFLNYEVTSLKRVRIMHITLGNLPVGKWRYLSHAETEVMNSALRQSLKTEHASAKSKPKR